MSRGMLVPYRDSTEAIRERVAEPSVDRVASYDRTP